MTRPSWDQTWMAVAVQIGQRSLCSRDKVGAVIVSSTNRIVDTGYNGPPAGFRRDRLEATYPDMGTTITPCVEWCPRGAAENGWLLPASVPAGVSDIIIEDNEMWLEWQGYRVPATPEKLRDLGAREIALDYSDCPALHAEANALMFSDRRLREGGTIYVSSGTCSGCAKLVANSGLKRAVYWASTRPDRAVHRDSDRWYEFLRSCGIVVDVLTGSGALST